MARSRQPDRGAGRPRVALAPFLSSCPAVITLGIRANIDDYSQQEKHLLLTADRVFFPTPRFLEIFQAIGKPTFPHAASYRFQRSRVLQTLLFDYLEIPRPRARVYFGRRQKERIPEDFTLPLVLMGPRTEPNTVHRVDRPERLSVLQSRYNPVIVHEWIDWDELVRLLCVNFTCIGALRVPVWPIRGGHCLPVPVDDREIRGIVSRTESLLREVALDDIVVEWGRQGDRWLVLGMSRPPAVWSALDRALRRHQHICHLIQSGAL